MSTWLEYWLIGMGGTAAYELVRLYELMGKLPAPKFRKMIKGPFYLPVTIGLVASSAALAAAFSLQTAAPTGWQIMVTAIGMRAIVVKPVEVKLSVRNPTLGGSSKNAPDAIDRSASSPTDRTSFSDLFP